MVSSTRTNFNTASKKQQEFFSDFMTDLTVHPVTQELSRITNEAAVKRSLKNIILTNRNERLFNPDFGGNISRLLFEPMGPATAESIKHTINDVVTTFEPRVKLSNIEVIADEYTQSYRVNIFFLIVNVKEPSAMTVTLYKIR